MPRLRNARLLSSLAWLVLPAPAAGQSVVISQVYGGGGNSAAPFRNDFVELHNVTGASVSVEGWTIQYTSATGTGPFSANVSALTGTIPAGAFYLVALGSGGSNGADLPPPDATGTTMMSASAGKVALVSGPGLACNGGSTPCPSELLETIVDLVGYGGADFFEGAAPAPGLGNTTAALRARSGCADANDNATDFATGPPAPRSSASPAIACESVPAPGPCAPTHTIAEIQGTGSTSPFAGTTVSTSGVVTARWTTGSTRGFFVQMPVGDGNQQSSDGLFVFTGNVDPPGAAEIGTEVCVSGPVAEFRPASDPGSNPLTEIGRPAIVRALGPSRPLPEPVTIGAAEASPDGGLESLERFEGMRVRIETLTVVAPTGGDVVERDAVGASNGVFFGVAAGIARPFREPGIDVRDTLPAEAPPGVPRFDGNPERIRVDSAALGAPRLDVAAGTSISELIGPLHYAFGTYMVLPDPASPPSVVDGPGAEPVPDPEGDEFTVASFNLQRLFDTRDEPGQSDVVVTPDALARRLAKLSLTIRGVLRLPDVIGVEEAENLAVLQALAERVNADHVAAGQANPHYRAELVEGHDPGGIDVGVLVKTSRVSIDSVSQELRDQTYVNPLDGQADLLNDRPPLVAHVRVSFPEGDLPITLVVNHLRSLTGIDESPDGARVRAKRRAQAEALGAFLHARQSADASERIVVVGDFNAFEFSDGYVDVIGTIKGVPAALSEVVLGSADLVDPDFTDAFDGSDGARRYTYVFDGSAQSLDHVLVNRAAVPHLTRAVVAHCNADFPERLRADGARPERSSDHDIPVVYFRRAPRPQPEVSSPVPHGRL